MQMKHPFVQYILAILTVAVAFFSWLTIHQAVTDANASTWLLPILTFSLFFILLCLDAVLMENDILFPSTIIFSFLINLFFAFDIFHAGILILGALLVVLAARRVRKHMKLFVKIQVAEALGPGTLILILALTLVISSQYFAEVKNFNPQEIILRFRGGEQMDKKIISLISHLNPNLKHLGDEKMTVDQFILEMSKDQLETKLGMDAIFSQQADKEIAKLYGENISAEDREKLKQELLSETSSAATGIAEENKKMVLEEGRRKLSELAGLTLRGTEPMSFVFTNIVNWQMLRKVAPEGEDSRFPFFVIIMTAILFITIFPLGSILRSLFARISQFIFWILVKTGAVVITKVPAEVERIE